MPPPCRKQTKDTMAFPTIISCPRCALTQLLSCVELRSSSSDPER